VPADYFQPDDGIGIYLQGLTNDVFSWTPPLPDVIAGITNGVLPDDPTIGEPGAGQPEVPATPPTLFTGMSTNVTAGSAVLNGSVTDDGGSEVSSRGFIWGTSQGVSFANGTYVPAGGGLGAYQAMVTNLMPNVQYYFRAVASNEVGQAVGPERSFWTLAKTPLAPVTVNMADRIQLSLALQDGNPSNTEYAIQETSTGKYVTLSGALVEGEAPWLFKSSFENAQINVMKSSLGGGSVAHFVVRARNGVLVETAPSPTASVEVGTSSGGGEN